MMDAIAADKPIERVQDARQLVAIVLLSTYYGAEVTAAIPHVSYFPERALCYMHRVRDYNRVILVLPDVIQESASDYLTDLFFHDFERDSHLNNIEIFVVPEGTSGTLTGHFLASKSLLARLRNRLPDDCNLHIINASTYEEDQELASMLKATLDENELEIAHQIGTKSGSKKVFTSAGVDQPNWTGMRCKNRDELLTTIGQLFERHEKLTVKIDDRAMAGGIGNFYFRRPTKRETLNGEVLLSYLDDSISSPDKFLPMVEKSGCIVEEFIQEPESYPSSLVAVETDNIEFISWQNQTIINSHFSGFDLIPDTEQRDEIENVSLLIAKECQRIGYRGSLGLDFIRTQNGALKALEINARKTGVSHVLEFCDGVLRKHNRSRQDDDLYASYRRGVFAKSNDTRTFEGNVAKFRRINDMLRVEDGNGAYLINVNSLSLNGFVEFICIGSTQLEVQSLEEHIHSIFVRTGD